MCVWDDCPIVTPNCTPDPTFWLNLEIKKFKAILSHLQTYCWSLWPNKYQWYWSAANIHQALSSCIWSKASFLHDSLSAHVDAKHAWLWTLTPVFQQLLIHCRLFFCFLVFFSWLLTILTSFLWAAGDSLSFFPDRGSDTTVPCLFTYSVCTVCLGTCNCIETAPSDFPDLLIMPSFRSILSSFNLTIVVFMAEGCIKQVPLKWAHNHPEEIKRPCYKADFIDTTI